MKNTREIAAEYRLTHWAQIMQDRNASGLSIKSYCETKGIHENVYHYWQRKLRAAAYELATNQPQATELLVPGFTEVKLVESGEPSIQTSGQICIEYEGYKITADSGYPPESLTTLLKALMQPC